jgi:CHAT domain-containing protein
VLVAGPDLEGAAEEVARLGRVYPDGRRLSGRRATARATARAMEGAALADIAVHGSFRADNPLVSSLHLADGPLTAHELERLRRAPHLVVLSACEAARSDVRPGDELMGFTSAMLALGAATLVAGSGWCRIASRGIS